MRLVDASAPEPCAPSCSIKIPSNLVVVTSGDTVLGSASLTARFRLEPAIGCSVAFCNKIITLADFSGSRPRSHSRIRSIAPRPCAMQRLSIVRCWNAEPGRTSRLFGAHRVEVGFCATTWTQQEAMAFVLIDLRLITGKIRACRHERIRRGAVLQTRPVSKLVRP